MALDDSGLVIKRFEDIVQEMNSGIKERLGNNVDTSAFSLTGNFHSNLAEKLSELWELSQAIYDSGNLYIAEGASLDNLGLQVGVVRQPAKQTSGQEYFTGANGVVIPADSRIATGKGDEYFNRSQFTITSTNCLQTRIYVNLLTNSTEYKVTLDGVDYTYTSDADATEQEILEGLQTQIDLSGLVNTTVVLDGTTPSNSYLELDKIDKNNTMSATGISYLTFDYVVTPQTVFSVDYGPIVGDALTVTDIKTSITDWYSATNPSDFTLGSQIEDDNTFRLRILNEFNTVGSGTIDSITTTMLRVDGVEDAIVKENQSDITDGEGIPPKSYEVVVNGGLDADIGQAIWSTKPAGIYTHGSETVNIVDFNGYDQTVRFSRADIKYITIKVQYEVYSEEDFPAGAIDAAREAMLEYADANLSMDDDVIATRFLGSVYGASSGFGNIVITVAGKDNPTDVPLAGDYVDTFPISDRQTSSFATTRMLFETL